MRGTEFYVIDEISQIDSAHFDDLNKSAYDARQARDRIDRCDSLAGHHVHPFAMTRLVVTAGDYAQPWLDGFVIPGKVFRQHFRNAIRVSTPQ